MASRSSSRTVLETLSTRGSASSCPNSRMAKSAQMEASGAVRVTWLRFSIRASAPTAWFSQRLRHRGKRRSCRSTLKNSSVINRPAPAFGNSARPNRASNTVMLVSHTESAGWRSNHSTTTARSGKRVAFATVADGSRLQSSRESLAAMDRVSPRASSTDVASRTTPRAAHARGRQAQHAEPEATRRATRLPPARAAPRRRRPGRVA